MLPAMKAVCYYHAQLSFALDLIQTRPRLDYLPPRAKLITSAPDHPALTKKTAHQATATTEQSKLMHKNSIKMFLHNSIKTA